MPKQLNVRISDLQFSALDDAVASGRFASRAAALRSALELILADDPAAVTALDAVDPTVAEDPTFAASTAEADSGAEEVVESELSSGEIVEGAAAEVPPAVSAHPALVEQRVWTWAQERHLPAAVDRPAVALARRAAVPVLSGAAGALLATVVRGGVARRERARGQRPQDGARGPVHLFVVTRRG